MQTLGQLVFSPIICKIFLKESVNDVRPAALHIRAAICFNTDWQFKQPCDMNEQDRQLGFEHILAIQLPTRYFVENTFADLLCSSINREYSTLRKGTQKLIFCFEILYPNRQRKPLERTTCFLGCMELSGWYQNSRAFFK